MWGYSVDFQGVRGWGRGVGDGLMAKLFCGMDFLCYFCEKLALWQFLFIRVSRI